LLPTATPASTRAFFTVLRVLTLIGLSLLTAHAASRENTADALSNRYRTMLSQLSASPLGVPVLVTSFEDGDQMRGEVHATLPQSFDNLVARLSVPREWCQIVLLHLNIKACTHEHETSRDWLTFYSGRKVYESPEKAYPLRFAFHAADARIDHLDIDLSAATGPLNTSDYRITLGAIPIPQGSFVRFSYSYRSSTTSRVATNGYLATLGRGKVGFTVVGTGRDGKPAYVDGRRGIVERNAVRYYFAIQAHLEGLSAPQQQRFERALERWFELTERYPVQLHELEKSDYLQGKRLEFEEQSRRQQALDSANAARRPAAR
jgi:hypothetical protein